MYKTLDYLHEYNKIDNEEREKTPAFHECRACKIKVNLEKSITAYFEFLKRVCLPEIDRKTIPKHRTIITETILEIIGAGLWNSKFVLRVS